MSGGLAALALPPGDPNAAHWAERFAHVRAQRLAEDGFDIAGDEGTMLAWFAGAIETGKMHAGLIVQTQPNPRGGTIGR